LQDISHAKNLKLIFSHASSYKREGHSRHRSLGEEIASVIPFPRKDGFLFDLFFNWAHHCE
jgi:hypothetical protein